MSAQRTLLITGGTGFIGSALARAALERGERVRLLGRDFSRVAALLAAGATAVACDLRDRESVVAAAAGVDVVFHVGAFSAPWGASEEFFTTNVGGTENVLAACRAHQVPRLVHVSSPSVVFDGRDQHQLPDDAPYPAHFASVYSQTKKLAEDRVNAAFAEGSSLRGVILRPKAVFGPGDTSLLPRLIAAARAGRLPRIGEGKNMVELTYVDNVVAALLLAADAPEHALGKTFTITNHEAVLLWDVIAQVLAGLNIAWKPRTLPLPLALLAASLMERKAQRTGREPLLTRYTVQLLARTQTYDTHLARELLGYTSPVPLIEGISAHDSGLRMTFQLLTTGYCLADESHVMQGGRRGVSLRCPARVGLFEHPQGRVLFDTGYAAPHLFAAAKRFPYSLYLKATPVFTTPEESLAAQLDPSSIATIVVSHFHADHIAGLRDFPKAHFLASAEGYDNVKDRWGGSALKRAFLPALLPEDFAARATLLGAFTGPELAPFGLTHDLFGDGLLRLVRLPGHARGQLGLLAETDSGTVFLVADAAYCRQAIRENRPPHPVTNLFTDDGHAVRTTLAQLHAFAAAHPEIRLYPTHCTETDK